MGGFVCAVKRVYNILALLGLCARAVERKRLLGRARMNTPHATLPFALVEREHSLGRVRVNTPHTTLPIALYDIVL